MATTLYIDADACPVKDEVYGVASRLGVFVVLVANQRLHVPSGMGVEMVVVGREPDAADDWIAAEVRRGDVVVTADIPLAARCLEAGARAIGTNGREFDEDMIGGALAVRELKSELRDGGVSTGGPPPLSARDRSRFAAELDRLVQAALRE